jgi:hypothetical protein
MSGCINCINYKHGCPHLTNIILYDERRNKIFCVFYFLKTHIYGFLDYFNVVKLNKENAILKDKVEFTTEKLEDLLTTMS